MVYFVPPETSGHVERYNKVLMCCLSLYMIWIQRIGDQFVQYLTYAYIFRTGFLQM